jgi:site-specific DNA-methyltransferase (adenine-specific)
VLGFNCPTSDQYLKIRDYLNQKGSSEYLKQDYEDLKQDYEDLRRPFNAHPAAPYTDVWDFPTVGQYFGKHPCEKPLPLLEHIVSVSSRPEALVLDCFCGSGNVGKAALSLERRFIGCDFSPKWAQFARERIGTRQLSFMTEEAA